MKPPATTPNAAPRRTDVLPPIGVAPDDPAASNIIQLIYARRQAIINAQAKPKRLAASCRKMVAWGEDNVEFPDDCSIVVNKTKQVCLTQAANHLKDPIKATIEPVQKGEYSKWYWCGPAEEAAQVQIPEPEVDGAGQPIIDQATQQPKMKGAPLDRIYVGGVLPNGTPIPPQPLPRQLVKALQDLAQQDQIDPQWICQLNDEYRAKTAQTVLDDSWRQAKVDKWAWRTIWANIVEGWQLPAYEYDIPSGQHILGRNSIDATYIDQSVEDIDDAAEAGRDIYMDMDEALAQCPDQREAILKFAYEGSMTPAPMQGTVPEQYRGQFRRPLVRKIVWWLRNQPMKLTPEEAINGGRVQPVVQMATDMGEGASGQHVGPDGADTDTQGAGVSPVSQSDAPAGDDQPAPPPQYALPDGTPVAVSDPHWPTRLVVRQISIIGDAPAGPDWDIPCPYGDIPILHLRNDFVIGKPWGIGEPFGVRNLNKAYSMITDAAVDHADYNAHSAMEMHGGLGDWMEKQYGEAFVRANQIIKVPPEMWKPNEPMVRPVVGSQFSSDSYKIRELLGEDINEIGGRPDVTSGNTPTANASGNLVSQLSENAAAPLNFKAQQIVFMFEKLVNLIIFCDWRYKSLEWLSDITGVPVPLMALVRDGVLSKAPSIAITISTGAGAAIERKRANYTQWNQMLSPDDGLPLADGRTTRELLGIDPDVSKRRSLQAKKEAAAAMGSQQKPPSESIGFKDLPPEGQVQMAAQASIQLTPEQMQAHADQQAAQKAEEMKQKAKQNGGGKPGDQNG